jgi:hypothetical protein
MYSVSTIYDTIGDTKQHLHTHTHTRITLSHTHVQARKPKFNKKPTTVEGVKQERELERKKLAATSKDEAKRAALEEKLMFIGEGVKGQPTDDGS